MVKVLEDRLQSSDPDTTAQVVCAASVFFSGRFVSDHSNPFQNGDLLEKCMGSARLEIMVFALDARFAKNFPTWEPRMTMADRLNLCMRHLKIIKRNDDTLVESEKILTRNQDSIRQIKDSMPPVTKSLGKFVAFQASSNAKNRKVLKRFLLLLDTLCHPSNYGGESTLNIARFISSICNSMVEFSISYSGKIIEEVWQLFWEPVFQLCFSKSHEVLYEAFIALKAMVTLGSEQVREKIFNECSCLMGEYMHIEKHRRISLVAMMNAVVCVSDFGSCSKFIPIFELVVSFVDRIDLLLTVAVLELLLNFFSIIKIEESNHELMVLLYHFFDVSIRFMRSQPHDERDQAIETMVFKAFQQTWQVLFYKISRFDLFTMHHSKMVEKFVLVMREQYGDVLNPRLAKYFMQSIKGRFPQGPVDVLFDEICEFALEKIKNGFGCSRDQTFEQTKSLQMYLSCILGLCRYSSDSLVGNEKISCLVDAILTLKQSHCVNIGQRILKACIKSWVDYYPIELESETDRCLLQDCSVVWHKPSLSAINYGRSLILKVLNHFLSLDYTIEVNLKIFNDCLDTIFKSVALLKIMDDRLVLKILDILRCNIFLVIKINMIACLYRFYYYSGSSGGAVKATMTMGNKATAKRHRHDLLLPPSLQLRICHLTHQAYNRVFHEFKDIESLDQVEAMFLDNIYSQFNVIRQISQQFMMRRLSKSVPRINAFIQSNLLPVFLPDNFEFHKIVENQIEDDLPSIGPNVQGRIEGDADIDLKNQAANQLESRFKGALHMMRSSLVISVFIWDIHKAYHIYTTILKFSLTDQRHWNDCKDKNLSTLNLLINDISHGIHPIKYSSIDDLGQNISSDIGGTHPFDYIIAIKKIVMQFDRMSWKSQKASIKIAVLLLESAIQQNQHLMLNHPIIFEMTEWLMKALLSSVVEIRTCSVYAFCHFAAILKSLNGVSKSIPSLENFLSEYVNWLIQEGTQEGHEGSKSFQLRIPCIELFQAFCDLYGAENFRKYIKNALIHDSITQKIEDRPVVKVYIWRLELEAICSVFEEQEIMKLLTESFFVPIYSGSRLFYDAGRYLMSKKFSKNTLIDDLVKNLIDRCPPSSSRPSSLVFYLSFLNGLYTRVSCTNLLKPMISSASDAVRKATAMMLVSQVRGHLFRDNIVKDLEFWQLKSKEEKKCFLYFIEVASKDSIRCEFWAWFGGLLFTRVINLLTDDDVEISREVRKILSFVSRTKFCKNPNVYVASLLRMCKQMIVGNRSISDSYDFEMLGGENNLPSYNVHSDQTYNCKEMGSFGVDPGREPKINLNLKNIAFSDFDENLALFGDSVPMNQEQVMDFCINNDPNVQGFRQFDCVDSKKSRTIVKECLELAYQMFSSNGIMFDTESTEMIAHDLLEIADKGKMLERKRILEFLVSILICDSNLADVFAAKILESEEKGCMVCAALVLSRPYKLPPWMPRVLSQLASFLSKSGSSEDAKYAIAEFKRTHADTWNLRDRFLFTEEESERISELMIGPSYYA